MENISYKIVESACKRQEKKNFDNNGSSLTWVSMLNQLSAKGYFLCNYTSRAFVDMKDGWRAFIKQL